MKDALPEHKRAFFRWLAKGPKEREDQARYALDTFLPVLEKAGFDWVEHDFEGHRSQVNSISLEREKVQGQIDFITVIFDKARSPTFKVTAGAKRKEPPHEWIKSGKIIRYKSELDKAAWWGGMWWHMNKDRSFASAVDKVFTILPQLIDYLNDGIVGSNIWDIPIK